MPPASKVKERRNLAGEVEVAVVENLLPIVVGVDGSATARKALWWAAEDAVRRGRALRIVHTVGPWRYNAPFYPAPVVMETMEDAGRVILQQAVDEVRERQPGLRVTTTLIADSPAAGLRRQAEDAYEVVVGHRGLGGFTSLLLGSVGLHTAGYALGTVVVVRGRDREERSEIVAGVDLSEHSGVCLGYAFEAAAVRAACLRVVHAWCPPEGQYAVVDVADLANAAVQAVRAALHPWRDRYPQVKVVENTIRSHPIKALVHASRSADLVVVAARGHSGVRLGSVSHGLIHHADCPVAVVRPRNG